MDPWRMSETRMNLVDMGSEGKDEGPEKRDDEACPEDNPSEDHHLALVEQCKRVTATLEQESCTELIRKSIPFPNIRFVEYLDEGVTQGKMEVIMKVCINNHQNVTNYTALLDVFSKILKTNSTHLGIDPMSIFVQCHPMPVINFKLRQPHSKPTEVAIRLVS